MIGNGNTPRNYGLVLGIALGFSILPWGSPALGDAGTPDTADATEAKAEVSKIGDWPGFWGQNRDAKAPGTLDLGATPALHEVWRRPVGKSYSEVAVVGDRAYTMASDGEKEYMLAFALASGEELWRSPMGATHRGHDGSDDGVVSSPVVVDGRVFGLDAHGTLRAFGTADGKALWARDIVADFEGKAPYYGYGATPLPVDGKLVVLTGAEEAHNAVALDQATGNTVWTSHPAKGSGFSSPVLMTFEGQPQVVANTSESIYAIDPAEGKTLWTMPAVGDSLQSPLPMSGNRFLMIGWNESAVLEVRRDGDSWAVDEVWRAPVLKASYSPAVFHDGHLYGMNRSYLTCLDAATGELKWRQKVYESSMILVDGHLAVLGLRSGSLRLVRATPEAYDEVLSTRVFNPGARSNTGPMFARGHFLLRNSEEMVRLTVGSEETADGEQTARSGS